VSTGVAEEGLAPALADGIAVEAVGLGKQYRRTLGLRAGAWALRDCSFALPAGRVAALVGANGAGKTTLLSIVAGLLAPSEGSVLVGGTEPGRTPRSAPEAAGRVAFVAQEKPLYRHFTAADMLRTGAHLNRVWDHQRALGWLRDFDVPLDRPCGKLSGGQQAQVSFAVALGSCPSVLLLDEPLSNLDPLARREVTKALLAAAADTGLTVLLSTHVVAELGGVADYLLLLAKGRLLVEADVVRGRTITSWPSLRTDIRNAGGTWVDEQVVVEKGLVTSRKPDDLPAFCAKIIEEFAEGRHEQHVGSLVVRRRQREYELVLLRLCRTGHLFGMYGFSRPFASA